MVRTGTSSRDEGLTRRDALMWTGLGAAIAAGLSVPAPARAALRTGAHIVVAGAGAAGLAAASRLATGTDGARITIIDAREVHRFQPGFTLVGAGVWGPDQVVTPNARFMPDGVRWVRSDVAEFDPDANAVVTASGERVAYDYLVVATGLSLEYGAIEGMSEALIGRDGIASIYAGPEAAAASSRALAEFAQAGGVGLFGRPTGEMKCAGAPLKYTFIADDFLRRAGNRGRAELIYNAHNQTVFGVPVVDARVRELFDERDVSVAPSHVLNAIEPGARRARFSTPEGEVERTYDFIHVVPPMKAPAAVRQSPLAWSDGPFAADGWLDVDRTTLQHRRFPNVFGIGDVNGVPKGKTAASVKWQAPVAVDNLLSVIADRPLEAAYNGYTSCPLITRIGRAMLIEFDYENRLVPSFPFIDPLKELWVSWAIDEKALKPTYYAMLRGLA